jgi:hypothetical protein
MEKVLMNLSAISMQMKSPMRLRILPCRSGEPLVCEELPQRSLQVHVQFTANLHDKILYASVRHRSSQRIYHTSQLHPFAALPHIKTQRERFVASLAVDHVADGVVEGGGADVGTERLQLLESTASEEDPAGQGVHMRG